MKEFLKSQDGGCPWWRRGWDLMRLTEVPWCWQCSVFGLRSGHMDLFYNYSLNYTYLYVLFCIYIIVFELKNKEMGKG